MSTEQTIRTRLGIFLNAVNDINALGFEEVYTTPPPNFPTARAMVVEIESEESSRAEGAGYAGDAHCIKRTFNVKIACVWGEVDPGDQALGIENKVTTIRDAIEQSSWLLAEDNHVLPEFQELHVVGIEKRYKPEGYMDAGMISLQFVYHEAWIRDNTLAVISTPDIASDYTIAGTGGGARSITINWSVINSGGITGFKIYHNTTDSKPATPTATVLSTVTTYTLIHDASAYYYLWVDAYNDMMTKSSKIITSQ